MRRLFFLIMILLLTAGCTGGILQLQSGQLRGEQYWQGRVEIRGDVELASGSSLTIAPGSEVVFLPVPDELDRFQDHPHFVGSELILRGRVRAEGTKAAPITFRPQDPEAPAGSWGGVNIIESPGAAFAHVLFQGADSALHIQDSTASVSHSIFRRNLVGVRFHSSRIRIENNLFENNGSGIRFHFGAPLISRNIFKDNDKSLFITAAPQDYRIEKNHFSSTRNYHVVLGEEVPDAVRLAGNWWGGNNAATIERRFFDGRRDSHLGIITYQPQLTQPLADAGPQ